ncbi:MAG: hypothetical protein INR73_01560 [Williamsia sp.]|nr:hypothetical protein [Williamsia sp.]
MKLSFFDLLQSQLLPSAIFPNVNGTLLQQLPNIPNNILTGLPGPVHEFISYIAVEELHTAFDNGAIVYTGTCVFDGSGAGNSSPTLHATSGSFLQPGDLKFSFRLTIPRRGSAGLQAAINNMGAGLNGNPQNDFNDLTTTLNLFGGTGAGASPSDYPNRDFNLELLFNTVILHLPPKDFLPARLNADGLLEKDPDYDEVQIHLPKIALVISQTADNLNNTQVNFKNWGTNSLDDANDNAAGELVSMVPALCLHSSGIVGFGVEKVVMDLSTQFTPPEILESNFGVGDEFTGLWFPEVRLFVAPAGLKGLAVDTWAKDMLIDFNQGLSGEFGIEVVNGAGDAKLAVQLLLYQGKQSATITQTGADKIDAGGNTVRSSRSTVAADGRLQIRMRGGQSDYGVTVKKSPGFADLPTARTGTILPAVALQDHPNANEWPINENAAGKITLYVKVEDANHKTWEETLQLTLAAPGASFQNTTQIGQPGIDTVTGNQGYSIFLAPLQPDADAVLVQTNPDFASVTYGAGTAVSRNADATYRIPVQRDNQWVNVAAAWTGASKGPADDSFSPAGSVKGITASHGSNIEIVNFGYDCPGGESCGIPNPDHYPVDTDDYIAVAAAHFIGTPNARTPDQDALFKRLQQFAQKAAGKPIDLYGYASYENHADTYHYSYNERLSDRRARTLQQMLLGTDPSLTITYTRTSAPDDYMAASEHAKGDHVAEHDPASFGHDPDYWVAVAYIAGQPVAAGNNATTRVKRDLDTVIPVPVPRDQTPQARPPKTPELFRRMGIRVKFQRNQLVLAEINGQFDFAKEATVQTEHVRNTSSKQISPSASQAGNSIAAAPGASNPATPDSNPAEHKGLVDFRLAMVYDSATRKLTQTLELGFDRSNLRDGLVSTPRFDPVLLADVIGSLLLFAPLLNTGIDAIQNAQNSADRVKACVLGAAEMGVAVALGLAAIKLDRITLFGGELSFTETSPDIWLGNAQSLNEVGVLLDYGVAFRININIFNFFVIKTREVGNNNIALQPPFVRYKAIGFKLNFENNQVDYIPVFDTSKGYELSLGDPGALQVLVAGQDIGNLLKVAAARFARENPYVLEMDLALGINLGVIAVDQIRIAAKIDPAQDPASVDISVIPTKISVNIPGALTGSGFLDVGRPKTMDGDSSKMHDGFKGAVDLTLVPLKLRIAASVGLGPVSDPATGRSATAFFLGLEVELPTAIPLGSTGVGIYGFLGLFAMHYKRMEPAEQDGQLPPALRWFDEVVHGNVIDINGWEPRLDRWSFGLGVILGTMEGGFVMNMKGMFMLELPGPRILIFVKATLLFPKPDQVKNKGNQQTLGILAVVDLDFNIGRLTIGLIIQYEIESVLSLRIPVDAQFNFDKAADWHIYLGNNKMPAEAKILGIVRGYAYLMFAGDGIPDFPVIGGPQLLHGFSIALGFGASMILGDQGSGLYLEVGGDFKAGIAFSPLTIYGFIDLRGELHLWVVSISAWASLEVKAYTKHDEAAHKEKFVTKVHGEACAKVSLLFFDVEGCVTVDIGDDPDLPPPQKLINGLTLVSRSPALVQGQGTDAPIDGALGHGVELMDGVPVDEEQLPEVPIDAILALNLHAAPIVAGCTSFTDGPLPAPLNPQTDYWVDAGANDTWIRYTLKSISLDKPLVDDTQDKPATWWIRENDKNHAESSCDLALLSWLPDATPRAFHQSQELTDTVTKKWAHVCDPVAPATSVLFTFNYKPLGYNSKGWKLKGTMWPDPPAAIRTQSPDLDLYVHEPASLPMALLDKYRQQATGGYLDHAKVIGMVNNTDHQPAGRVLQLPFLFQLLQSADPNVKVPDDIAAYLKKEEPESILIESNPLAGASILIAVDEKNVGISNVTVRSLDSKGKLLDQRSAAAYGAIKINSINDLPVHWKDPSGPWMGEIAKVFTTLQSLNKSGSLAYYLIPFVSSQGPVTIQLLVKKVGTRSLPPSLLLAAIETLQAAEVKRYNQDKETQEHKKEIITDAFGGDKPRALLQPKERYTLSVTYGYEIKVKDDVKASGDMTQQFVFRTQDKAPLRVDPWVLATTPQNGMGYHFAKDAVKIYFNDATLFQLFGAYGHELKLVVRKANGKHPPQNEPDLTLLEANPNMSDEKAVLKTPFNHTLDEVLTPAAVPCITDKGESVSHKVINCTIPLERRTTYSIEIQSKTPVAPLPGQPLTPLYKMQFTTSRFNSIFELAEVMRNSYITLRVLKSPLDALSQQCSDNDMQTALLKAGLDALPPADDPKITLLWANAGASFQLQAILLDAPEPLWRVRPYLNLETISDETGWMKHWVNTERPELELIEFGTSVVQSMSYNQTGSRTIVYLKPGAAGSTIRLSLLKHLFTLDPDQYDIPANKLLAEMLNIQLPTVPPWEEED